MALAVVCLHKSCQPSASLKASPVILASAWARGVGVLAHRGVAKHMVEHTTTSINNSSPHTFMPGQHTNLLRWQPCAAAAALAVWSLWAVLIPCSALCCCPCSAFGTLGRSVGCGFGALAGWGLLWVGTCCGFVGCGHLGHWEVLGCWVAALQCMPCPVGSSWVAAWQWCRAQFT